MAGPSLRHNKTLINLEQQAVAAALAGADLISTCFAMDLVLSGI